MSKEKKILIIIIVNMMIVVAEIAFGIVANSYALIADALHNAGDVLAVIITFIALKLSIKSATFKQTFGYLRAEMMAAFVNTLFLFVAMAFVLYEAINKLFNPEVINPIYMIFVGFIAMVANGISAYVLSGLGVEHHHHGDDCHHTHEDANIKSAYLHMLGDALISVGVVVAGVCIYFFKVYSIDGILTIVFSLYILKESYPLLKTSFLSLMDMNIVGIEKEDLEHIILEDKEVVGYHDLHIYKPSSKDNFISLHVILNDDKMALWRVDEITSSIQTKLEAKGFNHILIQAESQELATKHPSCESK